MLGQTCLVAIDRSKMRASIVNLLQAFGIQAKEVDRREDVHPASFAIVQCTTGCISLASSIQKQGPRCRIIVLTSNSSTQTPSVVRETIENPIFLMLPATVLPQLVVFLLS